MASPVPPAVWDVEDDLARLRWCLDLNSARNRLLLEQVRRQIARLDSSYEAAAAAQARDPEMTAALRRLVSHRRVAS
jgi:hypothetical protein